MLLPWASSCLADLTKGTFSVFFAPGFNPEKLSEPIFTPAGFAEARLFLPPPLDLVITVLPAQALTVTGEQVIVKVTVLPSVFGATIVARREGTGGGVTITVGPVGVPPPPGFGPSGSGSGSGPSPQTLGAPS